jgi:hypothetical protein
VCEFQHAAPHLVRSFLRFPLPVTECVADCVWHAAPEDADAIRSSYPLQDLHRERQSPRSTTRRMR